MEEERESKEESEKKCCGNVHFRSGTEIARNAQPVPRRTRRRRRPAGRPPIAMERYHSRCFVAAIGAGSRADCWFCLHTAAETGKCGSSLLEHRGSRPGPPHTNQGQQQQPRAGPGYTYTHLLEFLSS